MAQFLAFILAIVTVYYICKFSKKFLAPAFKLVLPEPPVASKEDQLEMIVQSLTKKTGLTKNICTSFITKTSDGLTREQIIIDFQKEFGMGEMEAQGMIDKMLQELYEMGVMQ